MQKVGERNNVEVKGTTAAKTTAFKQLEFFDQTLVCPRFSLLSLHPVPQFK